jgi:hypothetical protein
MILMILSIEGYTVADKMILFVECFTVAGKMISSVEGFTVLSVEGCYTVAGKMVLSGRLSTRMCPVMDMSSVNLATLWQSGLQLLVFYQADILQDYFQLWPATSIPAPWHNTTNTSRLLAAIDRELVQRSAALSKTFHVTQGILTPDTLFIMGHVAKCLKNTLCLDVEKPLMDWLKKQKAGSGGVNIVSVDFVELAGYIETVIGLNYTLTQ